MSTPIKGPHQAIPLADDKERFLAELFDRLWDLYRARVSYVQTYEQIVQSQRATFVNDHIAFRTFASQRPLTGIGNLSRIFDALGICAAGVYHFEDKHLSAIHFQHPNPQLPKLFISELKIWELQKGADLVEKYVAKHRAPLDSQTLHSLFTLNDKAAARSSGIMDRVVAQFTELPWSLPEKNDVVEVNKVSQYAAWVLVHGYNVNHFTSLVNSHGIHSLDNLEKTIEALKQAGVPMKSEIEGETGTKLRQTATEAVTIDVDVMEHGQATKAPWSYAYFELAEKQLHRSGDWKANSLQGFLGPQATNLFEMTRVR